MAPIPTISDSEWEVMKALWEQGPATAGQIVSRVAAAGHRWHARTVKTMLSRLVKKRAVEVLIDGTRYQYRARVSRQACVKKETKSFLGRFFDGAAAPALLHLVEQTDLPQEEIDRLKRVLERASRKGEKP